MAEPQGSWQGSLGTLGPQLYHPPGQYFRAKTQWSVCGSQVSGFAKTEEPVARG